jgi:hypothetical protein
MFGEGMFKRCLNALIVLYIKRYGDRYTKVILEVAQGKRGVREVARELGVNVSKVSHSADFLRKLIS